MFWRFSSLATGFVVAFGDRKLMHFLTVGYYCGIFWAGLEAPTPKDCKSFWQGIFELNAAFGREYSKNQHVCTVCKIC